ncbi:zinc finger protein [Macleaya cordata]|uniref:Zinc finger protein n=1 Tax=Macleaya cordata TaxID=56857 RepID=A0A200RDV8_MACCD|nr:zinc finger protein [Macleaya cordata]
MDFGPARKRGRPDGALNGNGGFKRNKQEMESFTTGIGSKSKPCTKFFSTSGCPFGEGCHFLHYVPGGIHAVAQMTNLGGNQALPPPSRNPVGPPPMPDVSSPSSVKTRMCKKFNSAEGCKFGDKCHFAHGERELGRQIGPSYEDPRAMGPPPMMGRMPNRYEQQLPPPGLAAAASFGASATAKISVDASLAGAIIGKGGVNSKQICRLTGAKLAIREHESDPNLRNIELEGTFDQIKQASAMVRELIVNVGSATGPIKNHPAAPAPAPSANNFKTKLCDNFSKGSCTFGERCHFAHGANDLRKPGI